MEYSFTNINYEFVKNINNQIKRYTDFPLPVLICDANLQVYWSNLQAKSNYPFLTPPTGMQSALAEFDLADIKNGITENGSHTISGVLPFFDAKISFVPIIENDDIYGIIAMVIEGASHQADNAGRAGKNAAIFAHNIRRCIDGIFTSSDSAHLKSIVMDSASWLSPHLSRISANAYEILRSSTVISEYAKYQSGNAIPKLSSENIFGWFRDISGTGESIADSLGIKINFDVPDDDLYIRLDLARFELAFSNILHNSLFYTKAGNSIDIFVCKKDDMVSVEVSDKGQGMTEEILASVFKPYFSYPNQKGYSGIGLGLTLAQKIISSHDGTIDITSSAGVGTTVTMLLPDKNFSVSLPLAQNEKPYNARNRFSNFLVCLMGVTCFCYDDTE